ncbi:multifunctional CCA protein [Pseudohongiella nitratireducens]|uniref:Multifunctional CCA protein n=1 Tax=Pseudohongiella nitratireducens TaxID=1768907 RepID=A0A916QIY9_9GAMM|nr:multifunctional CCA addition/repair protein [Pseudohongiella nitratireducens]GFZ76093.1 multifunctional CCA protein [Pseudohongiella nitratireducens]|tara:strand:- start:1626 stop:2945 length:1320 start_codon:yes stop_codon:yes gene_type:complete
MNTYLVGGAIRDEMLGLKGADKDWVVVGSTPEAMISLGYTPVGKDFPVFLHPKSGQEYALARTERKSGKGYTGFVVHAAPDVTLEEDLQRRDLTINAMARADDGTLIDPYGGARDLDARLLRHVSPAFSEDPLRILRVARFAARFHAQGFEVAAETMTLMRDMSQSGELQALTPERIWQEMHKTLQHDDCPVFFEVLRECGALKEIMPELDRLFGIPQPPQWHPEVDTGVHTLMVLKQACLLTQETDVRFAALVHDLGKGETPAEMWPSHRGHETLGLKPIKALCQRLKVPRSASELACLTSEFHTHVHRALSLKPSTLLKTLEKLDAFRRPERFQQFLLACKADSRGRTGFEQIPYLQANHFQAALDASKGIAVPELLERFPVPEGQVAGPHIQSILREARLSAIRHYCKNTPYKPDAVPARTSRKAPPGDKRREAIP